MTNTQVVQTPPTGVEGLMHDILAQTPLQPCDEAYAVARRGLQAFVGALLDKQVYAVDKTAIDVMIAAIDERISLQVNEILHHEDFQNLERTWRELKFLVDRVDFRENIRVEMLSVTKDELYEDFADAPEVPHSGLYNKVYAKEYGQHGGKPYGVICAAYDFGPGAYDMALLGKCAAVAAMAHAPFIANAAAEFFGGKSFEALAKLNDIESYFEMPTYTKWHAFRESEDSRYVALCLPRFLLRLPYGPRAAPVSSFNFIEEVMGHHERYLFGHASVALVTRIADSFAKYRWCPNIVGPQAGGTVEDLPLHHYEALGEIQTKVPTEVFITDRRELELSQEGFVAMTFRKDSDNACFFSANSCQKPKTFGNTPAGLQAETNYRLGTQLPYMFVITRLAHYLKVLQREQIGSWKEKGDLERELNKWLSQYISDMEDPSPGVRARRPLKKGAVAVEDVQGQAGWYRCRIDVQPHLKYMGASFTLSLVGRLDKA